MMSKGKKVMSADDLTLKVEVAKIKHASNYSVTATANQLTAMATRLYIPSLSSFSANLVVSPRGEYHTLSGDFQATLTLTCSRTAEDFETEIRDSFECVLSHTEFEHHTLDVEVYEDELDIAEIAIQYLSLTLPDYPLHPKVQASINVNDLVYSDEGEIVQDDPHQKFKDALAELKRKQ